MHGNDSDFSYFPPSSASPTNNISQKQSQSQNTFDNTVNFSLLDNQQAHVPQKMSYTKTYLTFLKIGQSLLNDDP